MRFGSRLQSAWKPLLVVLSLSLLIGGSFRGLVAISYGELLVAIGGIAVCVVIFIRMGDRADSADSESVWNAPRVGSTTVDMPNPGAWLAANRNRPSKRSTTMHSDATNTIESSARSGR